MPYAEVIGLMDSSISLPKAASVRFGAGNSAPYIDRSWAELGPSRADNRRFGLNRRSCGPSPVSAFGNEN
jgi:hypothetical protein